MREKISLDELHEEGRLRAAAAATSLVGLSPQQVLSRIAELRVSMATRKSALAGAGFSSEEVRAWEDGYIAGLIERVGGWLRYSGAGTP